MPHTKLTIGTHNEVDLLNYLLTPPSDGDYNLFGMPVPWEGSLPEIREEQRIMPIPAARENSSHRSVAKRGKIKEAPYIDPELALKRKKQNEAARRSREKKQNELRTCHEELARVKRELAIMTERVKELEKLLQK